MLLAGKNRLLILKCLLSYDEKLEEKFQEQSVWLEEREALLQKTAEELAEMKKKLASYESSKETESAAEEDAESDSEKKPWLRKILG